MLIPRASSGVSLSAEPGHLQQLPGPPLDQRGNELVRARPHPRRIVANGHPDASPTRASWFRLVLAKGG